MRWRDAERNIDTDGVVVKSPNGYPIQNPYLAVAAAAQKTMIHLLEQFGMTPAAISRCQVEKPDEADELTAFNVKRA